MTVDQIITMERGQQAEAARRAADAAAALVARGIALDAGRRAEGWLARGQAGPGADFLALAATLHGFADSLEQSQQEGRDAGHE